MANHRNTGSLATDDASERPKILVVDDDDGNRALLRAYLGAVFEVIEASEALAAIELVRQAPIDLVLLDVRMPAMNGLDACRLIKQMTADRYLPVILLTALGEQEERNAGLEAGADDFLTKPIDRRELRLRLQTFVRLKKQDERIRGQMRELTARDQLISCQLNELEELARQKQSAVEELKTVNRDLEAFTYSVSHDLRAPLRALSGFSEILLTDHGERLEPEARSHVERIRGAAGRMAVLVEALLGLAQTSRRPLNRREVSLTDIAKQVVQELRGRDPRRQVAVGVQEGLVAQADPELVAIAIDNLLGNAWKFTARRDAAAIDVGCAVVRDVPAFFVRDNGAGFDPAFADRLFQPFQRLHRASDFEGTGVGLATVARIVARHGGRIWAEGQLGVGAEFFFTLANDTTGPDT